MPNFLSGYELDGVQCEVCGNSGFVTWCDSDGLLRSKECECMERRRSLRTLRKSGMLEMLERYTFSNYAAADERQKKVKALALEFAKRGGGWFYIHGRAGTGKTHICTAICNELLQQGKPIKYMLWRDESVALKATVNSHAEYSTRINRLKTVKVLYIDDFFKSKAITDADVNLAFEIINFRYNDSKLITIISSEKSIEDVLEIDEAIGSRIYERAKEFYLAAPTDDWRLKE